MKLPGILRYPPSRWPHIGLTILTALTMIVATPACRSGKGRKGRGKARVARVARPAPPSKHEAAAINKVIQTARGYMGTPHRMGGTTRAGIDCSALMQVSYAAVGVNLPRTSHEQAKAGQGVGTGALRPGDLVFFSDVKGSGRITHVGMVTEVSGAEKVMFIHTSSSLGVVENNLRQAYWADRIVKAVRP